MKRPAIVTADAKQVSYPGQQGSDLWSSSSLLLSLQSLLVILIVAVFIVTFCVQPFRIPSSSMVPTLLVGDFLLVSKQTATHDAFPLPDGTVRRGDIVVFHYPRNPEIHLIKRVIALPGERIRLYGNRVYINGRVLSEPYAVYRPSPLDTFRDRFPDLSTTDPEIDAHWWTELRRRVSQGELTVPAGHYFVLGDNRNNSEDSRYWGFVPAENIIGKPLLVYLSLRDSSDLPDTRGGLHPISKPSFLHALGNAARWQRAFHVVR